MDAKDKAIRLLVTMLRDIVDAAESRDEIKLGEQVAAAKSFLAQTTKQSGGVDLPESCHIGESIDVQVTRVIS
jgi:hypothetical protein